MTAVEELADMVIIILSSKSSHSTVQFIYVDGGYAHSDRVLYRLVENIYGKI